MSSNEEKKIVLPLKQCQRTHSLTILGHKLNMLGTFWFLVFQGAPPLGSKTFFRSCATIKENFVQSVTAETEKTVKEKEDKERWPYHQGGPFSSFFLSFSVHLHPPPFPFSLSFERRPPVPLCSLHPPLSSQVSTPRFSISPANLSSRRLRNKAGEGGQAFGSPAGSNLAGKAEEVSSRVDEPFFATKIFYEADWSAP